MVVEESSYRVEENAKLTAGLKSTDKDDASSDSICSVFEKMKPYWVRTETEEQTQHIPISPISSQSCLYSNYNSSSDDSPVVRSPMLNVAHRKQMQMNGSKQNEEQNCPGTNSSLMNPWLSSSYHTTTMFQVAPENMMSVEGNQATVFNSGFCQTRAYSWFDRRTYFNAVQWQTQISLEQQGSSMEQWMHPLYCYQQTPSRILPTVEPGDFSHRSANVSVSDRQLIENKYNNMQLTSLSNQGRNHLHSEPMAAKKRHKRDNLDEGQIEATRLAGNTNKPKKCKRDNYLRFERWEEENLLRGVDKFGVGKWTSILRTFAFQKKRSAIDLKDKYRNIIRAKRRAYLAQLNAMKKL
ncbi:hypothetical protein GpartN1_g5719.t1 [Galdieria partita]|uniref:Myb-like domain-containing protein n=1 Tax=Galdieria partita TaxID=83374 RepID=A0A9C7USK1_9RHOD|nr:hypothetical protein GpartN1_g5719.t1 [Galdieria partita]